MAEKDLISRERLTKRLEGVLAMVINEPNQTYANAIRSALSEVRMAPAVDAVPVVHGRWAPNIREDTRAYPPYTYQNGFKCSVCGRVTRSKKEPYCHCGAKMDKEEEHGV